MSLRADDVGIDLGNRRVVADLSLEVNPGELVVVAGGNGAGKSTLVRALAGELVPSQGRVTMDGRELGRWTPAGLARVRAVLRQRTEVAFPLSCLEVTLLGRLPHNGGVETVRDHEIASATLRATGVAHLAARPYASLSGGEKQRVQIARAYAQIFVNEGAENRYLLLDEPTTGLDLAHQHVCLRMARRAARRGVAVLAVLHDLNLAARYADRIVVLDRGRIVASGEPGAVLTPDMVARVFGVTSRVLTRRRSRRPLLVLGGPVARRPSRSKSASES